MSRAAELSVVLPCFNEAGNVARVVREAAELAAHVATLEIVVVDDGSTDETASIVEGLAVPGLRLVRHDENRGYGAALRSGLLAARHDHVLYVDGEPISTVFYFGMEPGRLVLMGTDRAALHAVYRRLAR